MTDEGQSAVERAFRDWWDPLERDGVALPWIPRQVFDAGYAAGAREQAGRVALSQEEAELVCYVLTRVQRGEVLERLLQRLESAALTAKEPAP